MTHGPFSVSRLVSFKFLKLTLGFETEEYKSLKALRFEDE